MTKGPIVFHSQTQVQMQRGIMLNLLKVLFSGSWTIMGLIHLGVIVNNQQRLLERLWTSDQWVPFIQTCGRSESLISYSLISTCFDHLNSSNLVSSSSWKNFLGKKILPAGWTQMDFCSIMVPILLTNLKKTLYLKNS